MTFIQEYLERKIGLKESRTIIHYMPFIIVLSIVTLLSYFYYNAFSPLFLILAEEFGFNEEERDLYLGSRLNTVFFIVGCPSSLIFSFIADLNSRKSMFITISFLCHLSSFFVQFIRSYNLLYFWRGLSGGLITSTLPIYLSLLGDVFPSSMRSTASVISSIIVGCGMLLGQTLSGFLSSRFGWRCFFTLISTLGLISVSLLLFIPFPSKGEVDGLQEDNSSIQKSPSITRTPTTTTPTSPTPNMEIESKSFQFDSSIWREIFRVPSNWLLFLQGTPGSIPWGVYTTYLPTILCTEKHISIDTASAMILLFGVGAAIGSAAAGVICDFLCSFNKAFLPIGVGIAYFMSLPLLISFFQIQFASTTITLLFQGVLLFTIGLLLSVPGPCIRTMLMNVNKPQCRSTVIAISEVFNNIGRILGPLFYVYFSKARSRIDSVYMISEFFYLSALFCFCLYFFYPQDDYAVIEYINSIRKEITMDVESPFISQLEEYDSISPEPEPTPTLTPSLSKESFLSAREGVNNAFKKVVKNALSSMDTLVSSLTYKEEQDVAAPLLVK